MEIRFGVWGSNRQTLWALGMIVLFLIATAPLFSQANQGTIQGGVFDESGGAIVGASVTVLDVARGVSRTLTTDTAGVYVAPNLIPGSYRVKAEAKGFRTLERAGIALEVGQTIRIDLVMQPGEQTQTVTVTAEAPVVDTSDVTLGGTIDQPTLTALPMNGRDFKNLIALRPAVATIQGGGIDTWSSNGTRAEDVGYMVDGLKADEAYTGNSVVNSPLPAGDAASSMPIDAIQEFNTEENPKAEFGWKPGAIINIGVKSGTNTIHGTAFAFGRDTGLDARNFFDTTSLPKQPVALEQFGGSAGGPVIKDKLFWFADYEGLRYTVGNINPTSTPATVSLGGNIKASLVDACADLNAKGKAISPLSAQIAGLNTATCAVAPTNYTAGASESLFPTNTTANPVFLGLLSTAQQDNGIAKVDYQLNEHNSINGMYFRGQGGLIAGANIGIAGASSSPFDSTYSATAQLWSGAWTWTPNSNRVNELRIGYDRFTQPYFSLDHNVNPLAYGINTGVTNPLVFGFPQITITGFNALGARLSKLVGPDGSLQFLDHYTIVHGSHTIKFGGEFIYNNVTAFATTSGKGSMRFSSLENFLQGTVNGGGNSILAGNPGRSMTNEQYALFAQDDWRATRKIMVNVGLRWEYNSVLKEANNLLGGFDPSLGLVQVGKQISTPYNGDFKDFSPRIGVAWDMRGNGKTVLRAGGSLMYSYLPIISFVAVAQQLGISQVPTAARIITQQTGPAGVAGSGTMGVISESVRGTLLSPNWKAQTAACVSGGSTACGSIFPQSIFNIQCGDGTFGANPCVAATVDPNLRSPYVGTWTLGIQQAITNNMSVDVSYVGTHGGRQPGWLDINQAALGSGYSAAEIAAGDPSVVSAGSEQATRPFESKFSYLSYIDELENADRSNYNALQATVTERPAHGLSFLLGYTYAHSLDNSSTDTFTPLPVVSTNPGLQYGASDFDIRNRITLTTTYALPGKKSRGQMLEGWQVNSVLTLQGGQPWGGVDTANDFTGIGEINNFDSYGQFWNFSGSRSDFSSGPTPVSCWSGSGGAAISGCTLTAEPQPCIAGATALGANTLAALNSVGCYVKGSGALFPAALGTVGNAGRNIFRDSGYKNWDLSVTKTWTFRERYSAQFRAEFFNVLNHPNFASPGGVGSGDGFNDPSTGQTGDFGCGCVTPDQAAPNPVLGSGGARSIQLGMKLMF